MEAISQNIVVILGISIFLFVITLFVVIILMAFKKRELTYQLEKSQLHESYTHQLLQSRIEVQEQTLQEIAKDLHDNVAQLLGTSQMLIGLAERQPGAQQTPDTLRTARATIADAIHEIRHLAKSMDKDWLEKFSFDENLQQVIKRINDAQMVKATYLNNVEIDLKPEEQIILFRIVQEAIQNALRHANASWIKISSQLMLDKVHISVENDGKPFTPSLPLSSMGLNNMQYRTQLLGGSISWQSLDAGTVVHLLLPINNSCT